MNEAPHPGRGIPPRRTALSEQQAQRSGGYVSARVRTTTPAYLPDDEEPETPYLPAPLPRSALRYTDEQGRTVIQQGNQRLVIQRARKRRRVPGLVLVGLGMLLAALFVFCGLVVLTWWNDHQLYATYGYPRYWQTDQVLGIDHDSPAHPSHLIFQNLGGHVFFLVIPAGDLAKATVYPVVTLAGSDAASIPVTATFRPTAEGKEDILVNVGAQTIVFLNTGEGFKPQM